jgi:ribosome-associated translation inhibitor RaiA
MKRESRRTSAPLVPSHIRVLGTYLNQEEGNNIRKQLGRKLAKFGRAIERVSVRVTDVNGPRKGIDQVCRIKVVLSGLPSVVVEAQDAVLRTAIGRALAGTERTVRRNVRRKRMKPVKLAARARVRVA